jgi:hypothetical protein
MNFSPLAFHPLIAAGGLVYAILGVVLLAVTVGVYYFLRLAKLSDVQIQQFVHTLEQGGWVRKIKVILLLSAISFVVYLWFFKEGNGFKGLPHEVAIEQAQIARELARGHGFSTKVIRPAALWQFERELGSFPLERTPDTFHAPLNPGINALIFKAMDGLNWVTHWAGDHARDMHNVTVLGFILGPLCDNIALLSFEDTMTPRQLVFAYDRFVAFAQTMFFLLAVLVNYFTAKRLFDERLAIFTMGMLLLCERFWDYATSGLPQMLMLLLFSLAGYVMLRAIEAQAQGRKPLWWLLGVAALFGLLALTHGLTIWLFLGVLFFSIFHFRPRGRAAALMLVVFLAVYGPWLVRNQIVCGSPVGLGWYSGLYQVRGTETEIMRSLEMPLHGVSPTVFRVKIQRQILYQLDNLFSFLGSSIVVPVFFVALLHPFKRRETASFRWFLMAMWLPGLFGMAVFGMPDASSVVKANDLHILFVPMMLFYGLALVLVMWTRWDINVRLVRQAFIAMLFLLSSLPFLNQFLFLLLGNPGTSLPFVWPPYEPASISYVGKLTRDNEIVMSDMPWAVGWYADRKSLWLPMTVRDFLDLNDYNQLKGRIVALYLTPVTGDRSFISEIMKGEYKEWAPFIMRNVNTREFPLKAVTGLPWDGECVLYMDRKRWESVEE